MAINIANMFRTFFFRGVVKMANPEQHKPAEAPRTAERPAPAAAPSAFHQELQERRPAQIEIRQPTVSVQPHAQQEIRPQIPTPRPVYANPETGIPATSQTTEYGLPRRGQQGENNPIRTNPIEVQNTGQGQGRPPERYPNQNGRENGQGYGPFGPSREFRPPDGRGWGWQDPNRWNRGWDPIFFQQDPNYESWQPTINQESTNIAGALGANDTQTAATELNNDLWAMRGDIYGQNDLLQAVQNQTPQGEGAQLYLGNWDPTSGTWDDIRVMAQPAPPGYQPAPSFQIRTFE
jgi:hypothetical protein